MKHDQTTGAGVFTPGGTRPLAAAEDGLRDWRLHRLRKELARLDLDRDALPSPSAPEKAVEPLAITVDSGDLRAGR